MSERDKMLGGALYEPQDEELVALRRRSRLLQAQYNATRDDQSAERARLLAEWIPDAEKGVYIEPPFFCDYGLFITLGERTYFNFNCVILDVARVTIGSDVLFGPAVQIYAATHPITAEERRTRLELGSPIAIGDEVWIGGGAVICPGVTIGARTVVGAGSVVTRDLPADVFAAGNPCRVIRSLVP